jgi:hypothetical protein
MKGFNTRFPGKERSVKGGEIPDRYIFPSTSMSENIFSNAVPIFSKQSKFSAIRHVREWACAGYLNLLVSRGELHKTAM